MKNTKGGLHTRTGAIYAVSRGGGEVTFLLKTIEMDRV